MTHVISASTSINGLSLVHYISYISKHNNLVTVVKLKIKFG